MSSLIQAAIGTQPMVNDSVPRCLVRARSRHRYDAVLLFTFLLTLPLVNPWVRGDGVGYYAYLRSLMVEHKLDFANDWRSANESFVMGRVRADGSIDPLQYTRTGHLDNHFAVGPSILWAPFVTPVHGVILTLHKLGINVPANGYSHPYLITMALATALYAFVGLFISFHLACLYTEKRWALLATLGIWFASSLPVYMYFNPSWSHAHSVFIVAVFLWYWHRTRQGRAFPQWMILGLISGLVLDVYYLNIAILLIPLGESLEGYWRGAAWPLLGGAVGRFWPSSKWGGRKWGANWQAVRRLFAANLLYCGATLVAFLPTLVTRKIIYGNPLDLGYGGASGILWNSPHLGSALFSSDHGLLVWTPILILAVAGLFLFFKHDRSLAAYFVAALLACCYLVGGHPNWDGISSFGNRFFVSLTPLFVLGLAVLFSTVEKGVKKKRTALAWAGSLTSLLIAWNLAFIFQWGTHMVPVRGLISWKQMVRNQFLVVPERAAANFKAYFQHRRALMQRIEQEDVQQLKQRQ